MRARILLVEDEEHLAARVEVQSRSRGLQDPGRRRRRDRARFAAQAACKFDLLVLDVMLPGKDGFTVATELRKGNQYIPLLMLTARGHPEDVLKGFASGADDYLPKPFDLEILLARIRSLLRRREWAGPC